MGRSALVMVLAGMCAVIMASCAERAPDLRLETTPLISGGLGWVVVDIAYARLGAEPSFEAADSGYARRGDVLRIAGRDVVHGDSDQGLWYRVETPGGSGWVHWSQVSVYQSRELAEKAAESRP